VVPMSGLGLRRLACRVLGHKIVRMTGHEYLWRHSLFGLYPGRRERYCARCGLADGPHPYLKPALDRVMRETWR
jgi:hypothetical protein